MRKLCPTGPRRLGSAEVTNAYRLALLRGVSAGHFLRKIAGTNQ
jgi:hypothetical protein